MGLFGTTHQNLTNHWLKSKTKQIQSLNQAHIVKNATRCKEYLLLLLSLDFTKSRSDVKSIGTVSAIQVRHTD